VRAQEGEVKDVLLLDVTQTGCRGSKRRGGVFTQLIEKNTTIPTAAKAKFSRPAHDNQTASHDSRFPQCSTPQGEPKSLGQTIRSGLRSYPEFRRASRIAEVEVTFDRRERYRECPRQDLGTNKEQFENSR